MGSVPDNYDFLISSITRNRAIYRIICWYEHRNFGAPPVGTLPVLLFLACSSTHELGAVDFPAKISGSAIHVRVLFTPACRHAFLVLIRPNRTQPRGPLVTTIFYRNLRTHCATYAPDRLLSRFKANR